MFLALADKSRRPVRCVGILGLGSIGLRHARLLISMGISVLGFDPNNEKRAGLKPFGGIITGRNIVLSNSDALIIASPSRNHLADLRDCIAAGRATLVEKPLGHDLSKAETLVEKAAAADVPITAAFNLRFRDSVVQARQYLAEGLIGHTVSGRFVFGSYLPDWRPEQDYRKGYAADPVSGGVILDVIHELDLALHLLGPGDVVAAAARCTGLLEMDSEDHALITLRHDSGALSTIDLSYVRRPPIRQMEIVGTKGVLDVDLRSGTVRAVSKDGELLRKSLNPLDRDVEYQRQLECFLSTSPDNLMPTCSAREALISLRYALDARRIAGLPTA